MVLLMAKPRTVDRIIQRIETAQPISTSLLASDLRLSLETVRKHVSKLIDAGRVGYGWDGQSLELTDSERRERAIDARVRSHR